jgi:hypothetical protein
MAQKLPHYNSLPRRHICAYAGVDGNRRRQ